MRIVSPCLDCLAPVSPQKTWVLLSTSPWRPALYFSCRLTANLDPTVKHLQEKIFSEVIMVVLLARWLGNHIWQIKKEKMEANNNNNNNNNVNNNNGGEGVRDPLVNVRDRLFHTLFFRLSYLCNKYLTGVLDSLLPMREQYQSSYDGCWSVSSCSRLSWQCFFLSIFTSYTPGAVCHYQYQL